MTQILFRNPQTGTLERDDRLEAELWKLIDLDNKTHEEGEPLTPIPALLRQAIRNLQEKTK